MGTVVTPSISTAALAPLDAAVGALAPAIAVVALCWVALALGTAVALRLLGTRRGSGRAVDRALRWLAPGVAGRLLRAGVGLGVTGATLVGAGFALPAASAAATSPRATVPAVHPLPRPTAPSPIPTAAALLLREARLVLATALPEPAEPPHPQLRRQPTPELWPLSTPLRERTADDDAYGARAGDVVVQRGDTLWSIAARQLPAQAPASRIEALWRRWYLRNRAVIGADPNLLLPGQVLRAPF